MKAFLAVMVACILVVGGLGLVCWNCGFIFNGNAEGKPPSGTPVDRAVTVDLATLTSDYRNEVKGDSKYKDKKLRVSGTVMGVEVDQKGRPGMRLCDPAHDGSEAQIYCRFEDKKVLVDVEVRQELTLEGVCTSAHGLVTLEHCQLIKR